jgi:mannitol-1-phosphate 5-dehydrogenase
MQNNQGMDEGKKILIFGAGRIGRSFIGQLFSSAGYRVVFVDVDRALIDRLNTRGSYPVVIRDSRMPEEEKTITVTGIEALHAEEEEKIMAQIENADVLATSVGKNGLSGLAGILDKGIRSRYHKFPGQPIDIILAENVRDAGEFLHSALLERGAAYPVSDYVGLVETSIGKMVPIMTREQMAADPLAIHAEPYNTLILDGKAFKNPVPAVPGLSPKDNMKAWVDRKIFIHNMGHATLAYQANFHHPDLVYTWEALELPDLHQRTRKTMLQSAAVLQRMYPDEFSHKQLEEHTDDLLMRFANRALGDTIFRVGCDLPRKLGRDDRLLVPILAAIHHHLPYDRILEAWVKGCSFSAAGEDGKPLGRDLAFRQAYGMDYHRVLREHCRLRSADHPALHHSLALITERL